MNKACAVVVGLTLCAGPVSAQSTADLDELAALALQLLNEARLEAGLRPLQPEPGLTRVAASHSREQAERGRVGHRSDEYGLTTERRVKISYPTVLRLAENVGRDRTVPKLHEALMASDGHRRNRLDPQFTHVGIGLALQHDYVLYITEVFVAAPSGGDLDDPVAFYFDAAPGSYEEREGARAEMTGQVFRVGAPGPDDPEYWTNLGVNEFERGDAVQAEEHFRHALELKHDYDYARYNLARVLVNQGRPVEAAALLDELLETNPDDLDARLSRGTAALLLQDFSGAERAFRRVLEARPDQASAWYNLGLALEYSDRRADAESAYRKALDLDPGLRAAQVGLGRVIRR